MRPRPGARRPRPLRCLRIQARHNSIPSGPPSLRREHLARLWAYEEGAYRNTQAPEKMTVRVAPLVVPEEVFLRDTDRKRVKKGLLGGSEEKVVFAKVIFLPYLDFTYRFPAEKGLLSKQTVISEGRSTMLALREA